MKTWSKRIISLFITTVLLFAILPPTAFAATGDIRVGFGRVDISPDFSVPLRGYGDSATRLSTGIADRIYTTCIAFTDSDGDTILLFHNDLATSETEITALAKADIAAETGVPVSNIMVTATHTHHAPDIAMDTTDTSIDASVRSSVTRYRSLLRGWMVDAAVAALADRKAAQMKISTVETQNMNFIRHYIMNDGTVAGDNFGDHTSGYAAHVTEPDREMQLVKFTRSSGKDIVLANFQTHPHRAGRTIYNKVSSDIVGVMRTNVESQLNCKFAYFTGASGNVNPSSKLTDENITADYVEQGEALADYAVGAVYTAAQTGELEIMGDVYAAAAKGSANNNIPLEAYAFSIGDVAFVTAPYEMFSINGAQIKAGSPFDMTFVATCANAANGYIPSYEGFSYPSGTSYGGSRTQYARGTGEEMVERYLLMLEGLYRVNNGYVGVSTAQELHDALQAGEDTVILKDIAYNPNDISDPATTSYPGAIDVSGVCTLFMAGKTVTFTPNGATNKFINMMADGNLTITGEGTIDHRITRNSSENGATFRVATGTLNIENGTFRRFYAAGATAEPTARAIIWNGGSASAVNIYGGNFSNDSVTVLSTETGATVSGGEFRGQTMTAASGHQTLGPDRDGWYAVLKTSTDGVKAGNARQLKVALESGADVQLTENITYILTDTLTHIRMNTAMTDPATLDLNGKRIMLRAYNTGNRLVEILNGAKLLVEGNGTINTIGKNSSDNPINIFRVNKGELTIENGIFNASDRVVWAGGNDAIVITINGGRYSGGWSNGSIHVYQGTLNLWEAEMDGNDLILPGTVTVSTAQELHDALEAGTSAILLNDIAYAPGSITDSNATSYPGSIDVTGTPTLYMLGRTITFTPNGAHNKFFNSLANSHLTITGNGKIVHKINSSTAEVGAMFRVATGTLTIENGTYIRSFSGSVTSEKTPRTIIWNSGSASAVNIKGGVFYNATAAPITSGTGANVTGGGFSASPVGVSSGYQVIGPDRDGHYAVIPTATADGPVEVSDALTLKVALENGLDVKLIRDIRYEVNAQQTFIRIDGSGGNTGINAGTSQILLDMNSRNINFTVANTNNRFVELVNNAKLKISGNGTLKAVGTNSSGGKLNLFRVNYGTLTIVDGTYHANDRIIWQGGNAATATYIQGGTFTGGGSNGIFHVYQGNMSLTGGTFAVDPLTAYSAYVPTGYTSRENADKSYTLITP